MTSDVYDSDDACNRSPPPVAQKISYAVQEPLPPFVHPGSPEGDVEKPAKGTPGRSRKHLPETRTQTRLGDSVLISYLDPSRPDIANHARDHPLTDWPPPLDRPALVEKRKPEPAPTPGPSLGAPTLPTAAQAVAQLQDRRPSDDKPVSPRTKFPPLPLPVAPIEVKNEVFSPVQPPRLPSISGPDRRPSEDPSLKKPNHSPSIKARVSLPSLQSFHSPPDSATPPDSNSNSNSQVLPSIHSALGGLSPKSFPSGRINSLPPPYPYPSCPVSAAPRNESHLERILPGQFQVPPSPFSHFSPVSTKDMSTNPSPASQVSYWRTPSQTEMHPAASPYDMSITAKSPATGYPTPTEQVSAGSGDRTSLSSNPSTNGSIGSFKCTHPGCTAPPFQTQYLLNSHANVHSQDRPHFCPVEGCPRGVGGRGFKRKNEMMRHGLVHNSPGYVCPFCPDQQHKYPRPDNLQRHVRVHHVDKNKDDPILRQVLSQRPVGSSRGRRRRMNS
ncbi:hypothetical protein NUU61_001205 [Penicillium alfredii]|uniref:C2H2-type domain-containing protein n=1 Tax=Penicillium alfredii TaxID=1506179 RepID=A0A9W9GB61_9EURO|nr:uncharacterized protein NUU61_001205 [Penicillium alfredii]KAJ5115446.1 hypothetical protein NUU61_001205 [Penicillium alfredii]